MFFLHGCPFIFVDFKSTLGIVHGGTTGLIGVFCSQVIRFCVQIANFRAYFTTGQSSATSFCVAHGLWHCHPIVAPQMTFYFLLCKWLKFFVAFSGL